MGDKMRYEFKDDGRGVTTSTAALRACRPARSGMDASPLYGKERGSGSRGFVDNVEVKADETEEEETWEKP